MLVINGKATWVPRVYQRAAWTALEGGCKRVALCWHRRAGKDDLCLNWAAYSAHVRVGTYWHMLPEAAQARKAIWDAVDERTGRRRIDIAFPEVVRETTRDQEMFIRFRNGSTWQVVGSDNFDSLVGSPPVGVVFSEYALANPRAWDMLRPILANNGGWAVFISTPRGHNHFEKLFRFAETDSDWYAQRLTVEDTGAIPADALAAEFRELSATKGEDMAEAIIAQEYHCSFNSPLVESIYRREVAAVEREGRNLREVGYDPAVPVHTAWDLGYSDDTAIWWYQVVGDEIHLLECHSSNGHDVKWYADLLRSKPYKYGIHWLPHDARARTLASGGKSIQEQLWTHLGVGSIRIAPELSVQDGIQALRLVFPRLWFDRDKTAKGFDALSQYQREWDETKKCFREKPLHDWTSHLVDSARYMAVAWKQEPQRQSEPDSPDLSLPTYGFELTINELVKRHGQYRADMGLDE